MTARGHSLSPKIKTGVLSPAPPTQSDCLSPLDKARSYGQGPCGPQGALQAHSQRERSQVRLGDLEHSGAEGLVAHFAHMSMKHAARQVAGQVGGGTAACSSTRRSEHHQTHFSKAREDPGLQASWLHSQPPTTTGSSGQHGKGAGVQTGIGGGCRRNQAALLGLTLPTCQEPFMAQSSLPAIAPTYLFLLPSRASLLTWGRRHVGLPETQQMDGARDLCPCGFKPNSPQMLLLDEGRTELPHR